MKVGLCSILLLASVAAVSAGCSSYASCGTCAVAAGCEWCPYEGVCTNAFSGIACSASVTNSSLCNDPCLSSSGSCERCLFASPTSGGSCGYCASSSLCFQQGSSGSAPAIAGACPSGGFATNSGECFFINSVLYLVLVIVGPILGERSCTLESFNNKSHFFLTLLHLHMYSCCNHCDSCCLLLLCCDMLRSCRRGSYWSCKRSAEATKLHNNV
mmetsp:Transcript_16275/g.41246  ORF Transcript_16275/g.41246 Transcript_16275/m.41246 type:complete len:214 (-) Transcript_16275:809-1450(-)